MAAGQNTELTVTFATRIHAGTGQEIEDYPRGLTVHNARPWSAADEAEFPQATRQVGAGFVAVVAEGAVYAIDRTEAKRAGLA